MGQLLFLDLDGNELQNRSIMSPSAREGDRLEPYGGERAIERVVMSRVTFRRVGRETIEGLVDNSTRDHADALELTAPAGTAPVR